MNIETQIKIKNNHYLYRYLRDNSSWYKILNRHPEAIKEMDYEMKNFYKMTVSDKIDSVNKKIEMIRTFMDILN